MKFVAGFRVSNHPGPSEGGSDRVDRGIPHVCAVVIADNVVRQRRAGMDMRTVGELHGVVGSDDNIGGQHRTNIAEIGADILGAVRLRPRRRTFCERGYRLIEIVVGRIFFQAELFGEKEERAVTVGIESGNKHRPADGAAEIVLAIKRGAQGLIEEISGIENFITPVVIHAAMQGRAARLGIHQNGSRSAAAVLGAVV